MAQPTSPSTAIPLEASVPMSQQERRVFGRLSMIMEHFHNNFRRTWNVLYSSVSTEEASSAATKPLPAKRLIEVGMEFVDHLTLHHTIEEQHLFPILAKKMPTFKPDAFAYTQHKGIHEGLDKLEAYLKACRRGQRELRREELKDILDSFGGVLWQHLDQEVAELAPEKMKAVFTLEEAMRIPI